MQVRRTTRTLVVTSLAALSLLSAACGKESAKDPAKELGKASDPAKAAKDSPLMAKSLVPLPKYFATRDLETSDLNRKPPSGKGVDGAQAQKLVGGLNREGYWPTPLVATSNPYTGAKPPETADGDYATTHVGDATDTSPYPTDKPVMGISPGAYIQNMTTLIDWLEQVK